MSGFKKICLILFCLPVIAEASPLVSPLWGFSADLPEEYKAAGGDLKDTFSFRSPSGAVFDIKIYAGGAFSTVEALTQNIQRQLSNKGKSAFFSYQRKKAAFFEIALSGANSSIRGFGLCLELDKKGSGVPFIVALAYNSEEDGDLSFLHLSSLDSIAPNRAALHTPGAVAEYRFPRIKKKAFSLAGGGSVSFFENDADAAQYVVDREFLVLTRYEQSPLWKEAWKRFFKAVYRDSFERLTDAAFVLERKWETAGRRDFAGKALKWVQEFAYERDLDGSDFVNPVSAAIEGRGDCDSRALLWATVLEHAGVPAGIMVSREYQHAMGLADAEGEGARFPSENKQWLVAETTSHVDIGLIEKSMKDPNNWIGIIFESAQNPMGSKRNENGIIP